MEKNTAERLSHTVETPKSLTVYKASAGSGKTFTLAVEYMKLLIRDPYAYASILAVTFTNKATEEMKMRILGQLYGIWKLLPDSQAYTDRICHTLELSPAVAAERAGIALRLLLHNYSYFRVETIDTFFQSVLRNLARELDLNANLRVELNDRQVEQQAVDKLIEELDEHNVMLNWIIRYIENNISEDKSWNIIGQLKRFGENIFKEFYKQNSDVLHKRFADEHFFTEYMKKLRTLKETAVQRIKSYGETFFRTLDERGLSIDSFAYGSTGICSYFIKLRNGTFDADIVGQRVRDCMADTEKWVRKSDKNTAPLVRDAVESVLHALLIETEAERARQWSLYQSAELTLRHLDQLRLLGSIEQQMRNINSELNRFMLSDTQTFLHRLVKDIDSPFIFEKIGTRLEHIMIDEFQDTSTVQWQNFKILLRECMGHGKKNLIVGDVKQSIYRWRSGDWRLLNNIETEFEQSRAEMEILPLDTNYRSQRRIIAFNNRFFAAAAARETERLRAESDAPEIAQLGKAYADVEQQIPEKRADNGYVRIELLPEDDYQQEVLRRMKDMLQSFVALGISLSRIAILVRRNRDIPVIADFFMRECPDMPLVSDEAFRLDASLAVQIMINALQVLTHEQDLLAKASLVKAYRKGVLGHKNTDSKLLADKDALDACLPAEFTEHTYELLSMPFYDLVERLYDIFSLDTLPEQGAYVCAFYDRLNDYLKENTADIDAFLREWDNSLHEYTIQSDVADGIRLISIHKSKGLEYDHVIIPFCDWQLEKLGDTIWCRPAVTPFNELPIVPIDYYPKRMRGTIYEQDYIHEHLQNTVDNLNLLYVAFTRASHNLVVFGKRKGDNTRSAVIKDVIETLPNSLDGATVTESGDEKTASIVFEYGNIYVPKQTSSRDTQNVFLQPVTACHPSMKTFRSSIAFRQSNPSKDFIETDKDENPQSQYIKMGNVLHRLFSAIRTADDIEPTLRDFEFNGILYDEELTAEELRATLREKFSNPVVADWFSDKWEVFNECTILSVDAKTGEAVKHRPDRVMQHNGETLVVDFKFGRERPAYHEQVRSYIRLLEEMGNRHVKGFIWLVFSNQIIEVK